MCYLQPDHLTCFNGPEKALVFARREDVRLVSLDTPYRVDVILPLQGLQHAVALDIDPVTGLLAHHPVGCSYLASDLLLCYINVSYSGLM